MDTNPEVATYELDVPVTVGGGQAKIAGTLSVPAAARTVQLLVHGYTYDRRYWDVPYQPEHYSYVRRANQSGYATLAIDRLGAGASTRVPSRRLTWGTAAHSVHQVVDALRSGAAGHTFDRVILVGHSLGSVTAYRVANRWGGVDALVITGLAHRINIPAMTHRVALRSRPLRGNSGLRPNGPFYIRLKEGCHRDSFGHRNPDPELLRVDEQLGGPGGIFELATALAYVFTPVTKSTSLPSLTVIGDRDPLFAGKHAADCSSDQALADFERPFYAPGATVEAAVIPDAGHCLTVEAGAGKAADRMLDFCDRHVGP